MFDYMDIEGNKKKFDELLRQNYPKPAIKEEDDIEVRCKGCKQMFPKSETIEIIYLSKKEKKKTVTRRCFDCHEKLMDYRLKR